MSATNHGRNSCSGDLRRPHTGTRDVPAGTLPATGRNTASMHTAIGPGIRSKKETITRRRRTEFRSSLTTESSALVTPKRQDSLAGRWCRPDRHTTVGVPPEERLGR